MLTLNELYSACNQEKFSIVLPVIERYGKTLCSASWKSCGHRHKFKIIDFAGVKWYVTANDKDISIRYDTQIQYAK